MEQDSKASIMGALVCEQKCNHDRPRLAAGSVIAELLHQRKVHWGSVGDGDV